MIIFSRRAVAPFALGVGTLLAAVLALGSPGCTPNKSRNQDVCASDGDCAPSTCDMGTHRCNSGDAGVAGTGSGGSSTGGATNGGAGGGAGSGGATNGGAGQGGGGNGGGGTGGKKTGCSSKLDCVSTPTTPICDTSTATCVGCLDSSTCVAPTAACDPMKKQCVGCIDTATCATPTPQCDVTADVCVECLKNEDCPTAAKHFCSATNVCVSCSDAAAGTNSNVCATNTAHPVCSATSGACVDCTTHADCKGPTAPVCASEACVSCAMGATDACKTKDKDHPVCNALTGGCVECGMDADCKDGTKPFCSAAGACVPCAMVPVGDSCAMLSAMTSVCAPSGACVQCVKNSDCLSATPVCNLNNNSCIACTADTDCAGRTGPGVCMSHLDGRCATDIETIYVQNNSATCSDSGGTAGGTAAGPFCSMQAAVPQVSGARDLIVVRGTVSGSTTAVTAAVSIIGQGGGAILGSVNPALHIGSGAAYARDLMLTSAGSVGLQADVGSTVRLEHLAVTNNMGSGIALNGGGILLDGAGFDIRNTTVTNNGPGTYNLITSWGGILINAPPMAGPKQLRSVTVQANNGGGISCTAAVDGMGVLASDNTNTPTQIAAACGFSSCGTAGSSCGAQ
ncbi:MAG TPA: hypothetical protein VGP07_24805 [Polyangia bacterium]|jgi:hypothetical protein